MSDVQRLDDKLMSVGLKIETAKENVKFKQRRLDIMEVELQEARINFVRVFDELQTSRRTVKLLQAEEEALIRKRNDLLYDL